MRGHLPFKKRAFDLILIAIASGFIVPVLLVAMFAIWAIDGKPLFYRSRRRVFRDCSMMVPKFRTMRRDAEKIVNRDTVPVGNTRFLNIASDSPLYTSVGRWIECLMLTELPQLFYVIRGKMSLVGNRPLPENVVSALKEMYPGVEARFDIPTGLTGPAQLVGRDFISDGDRIRLEVAYCARVLSAYTMLLDCKILFWTVVLGAFPKSRFSPDQVLSLINPPVRERIVSHGLLGKVR